MEQFAKLHFPESEDEEIAEMTDDRLRELVAQLAFEHPDTFIAYLEALKMATESFFAKEKADQP